MDPHCVEAWPDSTSDSILKNLGALPEDVKVYNLIYVVDAGRALKGIVSLRQLLHAAPGTRLETIMSEVLVQVTPDTRIKDVAREFAKFGFQAIPVVDAAGAFLGIVRYDSVLSQLAVFLKE